MCAVRVICVREGVDCRWCAQLNPIVIVTRSCLVARLHPLRQCIEDRATVRAQPRLDEKQAPAVSWSEAVTVLSLTFPRYLVTSTP
jgi:hypothetical protein